MVFEPNWKESRVMEVWKRWAVTMEGIRNLNYKLQEGWSQIFFWLKDYCGQSPEVCLTLSEVEYNIVFEDDKYLLAEKLFDTGAFSELRSSIVA